jgi:hypothetical protein
MDREKTRYIRFDGRPASERLTWAHIMTLAAIGAGMMAFAAGVYAVWIVCG